MSTANGRGRGINRKGRSKTRGKFVALGEGLITSSAWRSLSGGAIRYYIELRRRFNGMNNGELHLSVREAMDALGMGTNTVLRAQRELVAKGFLRVKAEGGFYQRMATTWTLTDEPMGGATATHDYRKWTAENLKHRCRNGYRDVAETDTDSGKSGPFVAETAAIEANLA